MKENEEESGTVDGTIEVAVDEKKETINPSPQTKKIKPKIHYVCSTCCRRSDEEGYYPIGQKSGKANERQHKSLCTPCTKSSIDGHNRCPYTSKYLFVCFCSDVTQKTTTRSLVNLRHCLKGNEFKRQG